MLLCNKHNFIFIHIYKTAGSSITHALRPFCVNSVQDAADRLLRKFNINTFGPQPYKKHIKAPDLLSKMGAEKYQSYFSFAVVRNPWDWHVSLYHYMLKDPHHYQHEMVKKLQNFDEYIGWRSKRGVPLQKNFLYTPDNQKIVDYIARFENLDEEFRTICKKIGISASLPHLNVSNTKPYREFYTGRTRKIIEETSKEDIELFGYTF